jgi:hypothetical protein
MRFIRFACLITTLILVVVSSASACTVFLAEDGPGHIYTINQEDWGGPWATQKPQQAAMLMVPADGKYLARIIFSWNGLSIEGGMNEKGLVYDFVALDDNKPLLPDMGKKKYPGPLGEKVLAECATVAEALMVYQTYEEPILGYGAEIVTDASGAGAIILWDKSANRLSVLEQNFDNVQSNSEIFGLGARYNDIRMAPTTGLDFDGAVELARRTLRDVTAYTTVYDQVHRKVRIFYNHNLAEHYDITVSPVRIPRKRFIWISALMASHAGEKNVPALIVGNFTPTEKILFMLASILCLSFLPYLLLPKIHKRLGPVCLLAYIGCLIATMGLLTTIAFWGRLVRLYGFDILHPLLPALPYVLLTLAFLQGAIGIGKLFQHKLPIPLALHYLLAAAAGFGTAIFVLSFKALY